MPLKKNATCPFREGCAYLFILTPVSPLHKWRGARGEVIFALNSLVKSQTTRRSKIHPGAHPGGS